MGDTNELFEAIRNGDPAEVATLTTADPALVNGRNANGLSAVMFAIYSNQPGIAEYLIEHGADLTFFEAAAAGKPHQITTILDAKPELLDTFAPDGFTALGLASFFDHLPVVELLLKRGAQVNLASQNAQKVMPLHSAVAHQSVKVARRLLEHGADVNAKQQDGFTPLMEAVQNQQPEMIDLLLRYDPDMTISKDDGQSALDMAQALGNHEIISKLTQHLKSD